MITREREKWIAEMMQIYGENHGIVQDFIKMCTKWDDNNWNNTCLYLLVKAHKENREEI